jgi:CspA family cold shock protein
MKKGKVKFFNDAKGYGFIQDSETSEEYFVHISGVESDSLYDDDEVSFDLAEGKKGINAINVTLI